jgi:uncharacterized membrane protein YkvA (DUF1232 family)
MDMIKPNLNRFQQIKRNLRREIDIYRGILKDERTPWLSKCLLGLAIGYLLLPFDLIPDFIPIIGHLDDAIIVPLLICAAVYFIPQEIIDFHRRRNTE